MTAGRQVGRERDQVFAGKTAGKENDPFRPGLAGSDPEPAIRRHVAGGNRRPGQAETESDKEDEKERPCQMIHSRPLGQTTAAGLRKPVAVRWERLLDAVSSWATAINALKRQKMPGEHRGAGPA